MLYEHNGAADRDDSGYTANPSVFRPGRSGDWDSRHLRSGKHGAFALDAPPPPWLDLGWIDNFQRLCGTPTVPLHAGARGAPAAQFRGSLDARIEFDFREWGKLQMALACGAQNMNVLACDPNASAQPSGGTPLPATAALTGSTALQIVLGAGAVDVFAAGDIVAVDSDYQQQTGY